MRLWSLHPKYLDRQGLLAAWREALLAQKVLQGKTLGYKNHPQLVRFRDASDPVGAVAGFLEKIREEAVARGYEFNAAKIARARLRGKLSVSDGQMLYEWEHLKRKLRKRSFEDYLKIRTRPAPEPHPLFRVISGPIAEWEKRS